MNSFIPKEVFFTKGFGIHKYRLSSFEEALRKADVANQNIVQVSSILPPECKIISREKGAHKMAPGSIRYAVMAKLDTNEHGRRVAASIGIAQPKDKKKWGYLSELHEYGLTKNACGDLSEDLAASMLGTTLGIELDPEKDWVEREQAYKASGLIVRTTNITQTATGSDGLWTTVVALAVFIL